MRKIYGSLVPVAQGPDVRAWVFGNSLRELPSLAAVARTGESPVKGKVLPSKSAVGFILIDSSLSPISFNAEAIQILSYPAKYANGGPPAAFLAGKIRSSLISQQSSPESPFVTEFGSGCRRYFCRAFRLDFNVRDPSHPSIAVLLERGPSELIPLSKKLSMTLNEAKRKVHVETLAPGSDADGPSFITSSRALMASRIRNTLSFVKRRELSPRRQTDAPWHRAWHLSSCAPTRFYHRA